MIEVGCGVMSVMGVVLGVALVVAGSVHADGIALVDGGASPYQIVVPDNACETASYAAKEFQELLAEISGVVLPIVAEQGAGSGPSVLIGVSDKVKALGLHAEAAGLGTDGVLLKTVGQDLVLLGQNGRGQLYAVYELLERYLGVRFLAWDCTVLPEQDAIRLPSIDYTYAPPFFYRHIWAYGYINPVDEGRRAPIIAQRLRLGGTLQRVDDSAGGCVWTKPFSHSFHEMLPAEQYHAEHPEYFALVDGKRVKGHVHAQLCLTHPDVLRICTDKVLEWCAEYPDPDVIISICHNDGDGWCECERCAAVLAEEGSQMGTVLRLANAIAGEVAKRYPEKRLCVFPYSAATVPPKHTKPAPNLLAYFCHTGCYAHGFEACDLESKSAQRMEQWRQLTEGRLFYHEYMTNFGHYLAPNQNLLGLVKDIRYVAAHGVQGVSVQGQWNSYGGELLELRTYLVAKLLWDPEADAMDIRRTFCAGYYAAASEEILRYLALLDAMAADPSVHMYANWDPSQTVTPAFVAEGLDILGAARARADSPAVRKRVETLRLSLWYMQLGWPDRYQLVPADAPGVLAEFRRIAAENNITHVHESIDYTFHDLCPAPNLENWLAEKAERYAAPGTERTAP